MTNRTATNHDFAIENLEGRQMLAANPLALAISQVNTTSGAQLVINGTTKSDNITVSQVAGGIRVANGSWNTTVNGSFSSIVVRGGRGNDRIAVDANVTTRTALYGGRDNDTLIGGSGSDKLYGEGGTDNLNGGAGDDVLVSIGDSKLDTNAGGAGFDSYWTDSAASEKITDASSDEIASGNVHRVSTFNSIAARTRGRVRTYAVASDLNGDNLVDPGLDTTAAKWKNFSSSPLFADNGPSADDVEQGYIGDCWFMSTLSAIAQTNANAIKQSVVELGDGTYAVQFSNNNGSKAFVRVDADLAVASWGGMQYAGLGAQNSVWVAIMEKAYASFRYAGAANYANLDGGWMDEAFGDLGYAASSIWDAESGNSLLGLIEQELAEGKAVTMAINQAKGGAPLIGCHAYTVVEVKTDAEGNKTLVLRNPWAIDGAGSDGKNDGYVTITASQALASFWAVTSANVG